MDGMIKLPLNGRWTQPNVSNKFGSLWYTENVNLDEEGVVKISPRMVNLFDDTDDAQLGIPVAFGRYDTGTFRLATTDEPFDITVTETDKTIAEDTDSNNPNLTTNSHGVWWQGNWYNSADTTINYHNGSTWSASVVSGLTSGVRHYMTVFENKASLAVTNGTAVILLNTSHSNTVTLAVPSDHEIIGIAYNNYRVGIITRLGGDSAGENKQSYFFTWDGATTSANSGVGIGADLAVSIVAYKSSFVILTSGGELLYWNGGGFDRLASFPYWADPIQLGTLTTLLSFGDNMVTIGDTILINMGFNFSGIDDKGEKYLVNNPSGIWCFDPKVGLYHKYSLSNSKCYVHNITSANVNTSTDVLTTSSTIPATGNPLIISNSASLGGLKFRKVYYVIKLSSTTFSIATTKENALLGTAVDITSAGPNNYIWMYDVVDYGTTQYIQPGAIGQWGLLKDVYQDIMSGATIRDSSNANQATLCTAVPFLEGRAYLVTPKLNSDAQTDTIESVVIRHRPLGANDAIIVKTKVRDYHNVPTSTPNVAGNIATWTNAKEFYTSADLSEIKTLFDAGEEIEIKLISGMGAGQSVKLVDLAYDDVSVYNLTVAEDVVGAASGLKSNFVADNWKVAGTITQSTEKEGIFDCPVNRSGPSPQVKIELRGDRTTITDVLINTNPQTK